MQYHKIIFAEPIWLVGILLIPILWLCLKFYKYKTSTNKSLTEFADPELLPHLIQQLPAKKPTLNLFKIWCLLWLLGVIAMAGPRYRFIEYETYKPNAAIMILLDLSQSMGAEDLKPNRIVRAKQQIQDLLKFGRGIRIGVIGFAKVPHLIAPITDDFATILHLLPAIDLDLITKQGVEIQVALEMAVKALQAEPGGSKHILIISDGNFTMNAVEIGKQLHKDNIYMHTIGVGTEEGAPYKDPTGSWYKANNQVIISKLNAAGLKDIAKFGKGRYWQASYNEQNLINFTRQIMNDATNKQSTTGIVRQWEESFFWLLFPMLILTLLMQRKHWQLTGWLLVFMLLLPGPTFALTLFKNSEQQGKQYYKNGDYEKAATTFTDPYRKGVALYKAGKFTEAEQAFKNSRRSEIILQAKYNLGNAQLKQRKYKPAIDAYEFVLKEQPNNIAAKENLAIAKQLLTEEQQQPEQKQDPKCRCKDGKQSTGSEQQQQTDDQNSKNNKENTKDQDEQNIGSAQDKQQQQDTTQKTAQKQDDNKDVEQKEMQQAEVNDRANSDNERKHETQASIFPQEDKETSDPETEILLKRLSNDIKGFLKNKFLIEEQ